MLEHTQFYQLTLWITEKIKCCEYGPSDCIHNTFFSKYEWAQHARVFVPGELFKPNINVTLQLITPICKL
jgi:hypothetical protein